MENLRLFLSRTGGAADNQSLLRFVALGDWFETADSDKFHRLVRLYVSSGTREVIVQRRKKVEATWPEVTLPNLPALLERLRPLGKGVGRGPISLMRRMFVVDDEGTIEMGPVGLPDGEKQFFEVLEAVFHQLFPRANKSGAMELGVLVAVDADEDIRRRWESASKGPEWLSLVFGDPQLAIPRKERRLVRNIRRRMRKLYQSKSLERLRRDAHAWVVVWRDYQGYAKAAWDEEIQQGHEFANYAAMLRAIRPFNDAFGMKAHEDRASDGLLRPLSDVPRNSPTRDGSYYAKRERAEKMS